MSDMRKDERTEQKTRVSLVWSDESGRPFSRNGECLDISSGGMKVKLDSEIPVRSVVTVQATAIQLHGSASVRSCVRVGTKYTAGLEFVGGMKWKLSDKLSPAGHP
jgi:PilZ domain